MAIKKLYLLAILLISLCSYGQKEANIWYFGNKAGVDFNSGAPVALTDGALTTSEGCASISDKLGNILFYTDGIKVYNRLHVTMPNGTGLKGDGSSTQSAIIVPKPGSTTIFYIFTVANFCSGDGLRYSEVDMTLDGGNGDVLLGSKNTLMITPIEEKVTAILHKDKKSIWIVCQASSVNNYYSYLVTISGIDPLITSMGVGSPKGSCMAGYLKSSSDGKWLVEADYLGGNVDVLKFDNATGIVSTWFSFPLSSPYGVEFSPSNSRLYAAELSARNIYQFDMTLGSPAPIIASKTKIGTASVAVGDIQLGPDKKMYLSKSGAGFLACIPDPDILGIGCGFIDNAVNLSGRTGNYGLPNFIQSFFSVAPFTYTNICVGIPTNFLIQDSTSLTSVIWNFGDPASGLANTSSFYAPNHSFTGVGTYTVKAIVTTTCCPNDTLIRIINIIDKPSVALGKDTSYCVGSVINLMTVSGQPNYLWNTAATTNSINVSTPGKYWVKVTNECGVVSDTILVSTLDKPNFNLGPDITFCDGNNLDLKVVSSQSVATYEWSNGSTSSSITPTEGGKYWAKATNYCGTVTDTIVIDKHFKPNIALRNDTALCLQEIMTLSVANTYTNYLWNNGTNAPSLTINDFGTYWVKVTNECGSTSDTFHLKQLDITPIFSLGSDTTFCFEESLTINVKPFKRYLWEDGSTGSSHFITKEGTYSLKVWNECGFNSDTIKVGYQYCHLIIPNVVTSNGDGVNDFFTIRGLQLGVADLKIINRWGNPIYEAKGYNNDWKPTDVNDGVYYYIMNYPPDNKTYTGFVTIFNGK